MKNRSSVFALCAAAVFSAQSVVAQATNPWNQSTTATEAPAPQFYQDTPQAMASGAPETSVYAPSDLDQQLSGSAGYQMPVAQAPVQAPVAAPVYQQPTAPAPQQYNTGYGGYTPFGGNAYPNNYYGSPYGYGVNPYTVNPQGGFTNPYTNSGYPFGNIASPFGGSGSPFGYGYSPNSLGGYGSPFGYNIPSGSSPFLTGSPFFGGSPYGFW